MLIMSKIFDQRINSWNLYVESTFGEYLKFAKKIINNNELQRKRVKTSKTIYSLLKNDLQKGCIMPPLVLALVKTDIIDVENPDQEKLLSTARYIVSKRKIPRNRKVSGVFLYSKKRIVRKFISKMKYG